MEPKIVKKSAFMVVGLPYFGKNEAGEIPQLWGAFNPRIAEIQNIDNNGECYGICSSMDESGAFEYVACFPVTKVDALPKDMVARLVPAQEYAVFVHVGALDTLQETYKYISEEWLPKSGYAYPSNGVDFEVYNDEFKFGEADSKMYLYFPIVKKA